MNQFLNKPWFMCVCSKSLLKTLWKKEKLLATSNFSLSHSVFPPVWITFFHGHQIYSCCLQTLSVWKFLSGLFLPLTSTKACEKSSRWFWKEKLCQYWCEKARKHICVTDRRDMTLAVKVALDPNTTNQPSVWKSLKFDVWERD